MAEFFTKRNHYNPCFWTALWNKSFFEAFIRGEQDRLVARDQVVWALNVRSKRIYEVTVDRIHYDKDLGVAEITPESAKDFCKRRFPSEYERLERYVNENPETVYLDFEDVLRGMEAVGTYECVLEAARSGGLSSTEHKGFVTCVLIIHAMRSHEMMASMIEHLNSVGIKKWEYFWLLKNAWGNPLVLARATTPLAFSSWTFYRTKEHGFPLCDSPMMIERDGLLAVLSPRLLLRIDLNSPASEHEWKIYEGIDLHRYEEFRRRSIQNSFKEIIFSDPDELERWRITPDFEARVTLLRDNAAERRVVADGANRVIWALLGFGRVPPEFESQVVPILGI